MRCLVLQAVSLVILCAVGCSSRVPSKEEEAQIRGEALGRILALAEEGVKIPVRVNGKWVDMTVNGRRSQVTGVTLHLRQEESRLSFLVPLSRSEDYVDLARRMEGGVILDQGGLSEDYRGFVRKRLMK